MKLGDLGERKLIALARDIIGESSRDKLHLLDDCAVLDLDDDFLLVTTDMISQSTHLPKGSSFWQAGWHLVAINLSDIAAMGGEPLGVVVALGLPRSFDSEAFCALMEGANACAVMFRTSIIGGDTKQARSLTLSACAVGRVPRSELLRRRGARPEDLVFVTGRLGKAGAALSILKGNPHDEESLRNLLEIHPRISEGRALAQSGYATAAMDISDGLAASLHQLGLVNGVGFEIELERIPRGDFVESVFRELGIPMEEMVLYSGGDYELLVTVDRKSSGRAKRLMADMGFEFTQIGTVVQQKMNTLIKDGVPTVIEDRGYEHFGWNR